MAGKDANAMGDVTVDVQLDGNFGAVLSRLEDQVVKLLKIKLEEFFRFTVNFFEQGIRFEGAQPPC